jgi:hypothetical protein
VALPKGWRKGLEDWIADEIECIVNAFSTCQPKDRVDVSFEREGAGLGYMYAESQLLVREQYLGRVLEILGQPTERELRAREPDRIQRVISGVVLVTPRKPFSVPGVLNQIDDELGQGAATPNHVLTVAGDVGICPATEPEQVYDKAEPYPSVCHDGGGAGVLIYLADTGLLPDADLGHPWLAGVEMGNLAEDVDSGYGKSPIPPYTAHGTFTAGVARCMAPAAELVVTNAFKVAGSTLESDLVPRLTAALRRGVDIIHLTVAAPSRRDLPLISFEAWLRLLRQYKGTVCLAAAGNSETRRPHWPAAFSEVLSVGALGADWRGRASFSNYGSWVDVYAPGRDLVNAYVTGTYKCQIAPYKNQERKFHGMAKWSGTSFSTPIVTGLIASRMSRTGENAQQAAAALLAEARAQAIPGVGAVLLPECPGDRRPSRACGCCAAHRPGHCGCGG